MSAAAVIAALLAAASAGELRGRLETELRELRAAPESPQRLAAEARLLHFLAEASPDDERRRLHADGLAAAARALAQAPDEPGALLWWAAHRGSEATPAKPLAAIQIAKEVEAKLLRLREVDPDHEYAAADRVLGHLYQVAPPVISVGSMKKAEAHLRAALGRAPAFPGNQLFWLELQKKRGDCAAVRRGAEVVLGSPVLARFPYEADAWRKRAEELRDACR
jgi:hypothetical protein